MEDLKQIWNIELDIPDESSMSGLETMKKTRSVITNLRLILRFELILALLIIGLVINKREAFSELHIFIISSIFVLGTILNIRTLRKTHLINIDDTIGDFLNQQVSVIRLFIRQYIIGIQGVSIIFAIYSWLDSNNSGSFTQWLSTGNGSKTLTIIFLINICLCSLCYVFYGKRLNQLNQILKEYTI